MRKQWKMILCVLLAVLLGGVLALCLWEREPQGDTDPNAPFVDLPERTKKEVMEAVSAYWATVPTIPPDVFWYGEEPPEEYGDGETKQMYRFDYGIRYYGTFGGYYILTSPLTHTIVSMEQVIQIEGFRFRYRDVFALLAYKDGVAVPLEDVYEDGMLTKEQIQKIYQCYERYEKEIYPYYHQRKEKMYEESQKNSCLLSVCGVAVILAGVGYGAYCVGRKREKRRTKDL